MQLWAMGLNALLPTAWIQKIATTLSSFVPLVWSTYILVQGLKGLQVNHRIVQVQNSCGEKDKKEELSRRWQVNWGG